MGPESPLLTPGSPVTPRRWAEGSTGGPARSKPQPGVLPGMCVLKDQQTPLGVLGEDSGSPEGPGPVIPGILSQFPSPERLRVGPSPGRGAALPGGRLRGPQSATADVTMTTFLWVGGEAGGPACEHQSHSSPGLLRPPYHKVSHPGQAGRARVAVCGFCTTQTQRQR